MSSQSTNAQQLNDAFRLHQQGRTAEAALLYERVIKADPKNCDALHFLGVLKASQGLFSEAKALIERSLRPPAKLSYLENYATILFQAEDYKQVIRLISGQADAIKNSEALQYVLAISLYKEKRLEEAIDTFDRVLSRNPRHVAALNEKGSALAELGGYTQALQCAEAALRLDPQYSPALLNQGNLLHLVNRSQEAVAAYEKQCVQARECRRFFLATGTH